jgi:hypothetical protein
LAPMYLRSVSHGWCVTRQLWMKRIWFSVLGFNFLSHGTEVSHVTERNYLAQSHGTTFAGPLPNVSWIIQELFVGEYRHCDYYWILRTYRYLTQNVLMLLIIIFKTLKGALVWVFHWYSDEYSPTNMYN